MSTTLDIASPNRASRALPQVELMGLRLHCLTPTSVVEHLIAQSLAGSGGYVATPNLDNMHALARDGDLKRRALAAEIRVADGMPLLWASRIKGTPLPGRVAGSDLIVSLAEAMPAAGRSLFLLGGEAGTADRAAEVLRRRSPGLEVVGTYCPPHGYERSDQEMAEIRRHVAAADPDFVYVGLPFPKAITLIADLRQSQPHTWFLGLGISFSFVCGDIPRAPRWMQKVGLEWVHRLMQEPGRLGRRYLIQGAPFALRLFWSSYAERRALGRS